MVNTKSMHGEFVYIKAIIFHHSEIFMNEYGLFLKTAVLICYFCNGEVFFLVRKYSDVRA